VAGVGTRHRAQMRLAVDQRPVRAFSPYGPHPAFGITIRPWRPRRRFHDPYAGTGEDAVECGGELGVAVAAEEPERPDPVADIDDQVACLLRDPRPAGVAGYPRICARRISTSMTNRT
jgi:hypothetical protein